MRRDLIGAVGEFLRGRGAPYIAVDEAKRALFAGQKLRSFHFVVYRPDSHNWLVWVGKARREVREEMKRWRDVFGEGFIVAYAVVADGAVSFWGDDGGALILEDNPKERPVLPPPPAVGHEALMAVAERNREPAAPSPDFGPSPLASAFPEISKHRRQLSMLGERYEGSAIGCRTPSMFGDMRPDHVERRAVDNETLCLF